MTAPVLSKFQGVPAYKRLLHISKPIGDAPEQTVNEIKKLAGGVVIARPSLISVENGFTKAQATVLDEMRAAKISVSVYVLRNECVPFPFPFDYFTDPTRELVTYVSNLEVDGVITEYPAEPGALLKQAASGCRCRRPSTTGSHQYIIIYSFIGFFMCTCNFCKWHGNYCQLWSLSSSNYGF